MSGTFDFCPGRLVPETKPPAPGSAMSMNGWTFSAKPRIPFVKEFVVTLHGITWYLQANGLYDITTAPTFNARRLELFYETNGVWDDFTWAHPHLGSIQARFKEPVVVPKAIPNSNGLCEAFEITLIHHDPGYA